ncbi:hypothetical protein B0T26DRAFT_717246 [Lasiosphaeria miniovina]|uniref:Uncharacterized protein n=1 Tax=Lasiosphaeria miniovina TaxID=1954250 RepID=A0AA40ACM3_9PEZI|nr:uncharacterized protein B0T26DRAFT_717246 [Lasiosphaeria miniovina]KAK0713357.1 hypothetical protein B0T26DRAFT_717246 [Lasiosphaeria miniovina]
MFEKPQNPSTQSCGSGRRHSARRAQKCFGLLVLINQGKAISSFIRHDTMQPNSPDYRLPCSFRDASGYF